MANSNCLEGIRCPKCKDYYCFYIQVLTCAEFTDEGCGDYHDMEWTDKSEVRCHNCDHLGVMRDFRIENQKRRKKVDKQGKLSIKGSEQNAETS